MYNLIPVDSSNIKAIGYDILTERLYVQFHSGKTYQYFDVSQDMYNQFLEANSKGKFFAINIKNEYRYTSLKLEDENES